MKQNRDILKKLSLTAANIIVALGFWILLALPQIAIGADFPITTSLSGQVFPEIAFDGTNYLVVWDDSRNITSSKADIFGAFVSP